MDGREYQQKARWRLGRLGDKGAGTRGACWVYASRGSFPIGGAELGREEREGGRHGMDGRVEEAVKRL